MGISYSTARYLAPASFLYDFALQQYGILSSPSMKDIHDANLAFWSPQPYLIGAFFFPQQLFQLAWLYRLWKLDPRKGGKEEEEARMITDYVPWYALGNVCIGSMSDHLLFCFFHVGLLLLPPTFPQSFRLPSLSSNPTFFFFSKHIAKVQAKVTPSVDVLLERKPARPLQHLCHHQQPLPALLYFHKTAPTNEHSLSF